MFSCHELHGDRCEADTAKMAADPVPQDGQALCMPCPKPLNSRKPGEWWASVPEVFHLD